MALSEREQKVLDEIEQDLRGADRKLATMLPAVRVKPESYRSMTAVIVGATTGIALVMVGLVSTIIIVSILGFLVLVATAAYATSSLRRLWSAPKGSAYAPDARRG